MPKDQFIITALGFLQAMSDQCKKAEEKEDYNLPNSYHQEIQERIDPLLNESIDFLKNWPYIDATLLYYIYNYGIFEGCVTDEELNNFLQMHAEYLRPILGKVDLEHLEQYTKHCMKGTNSDPDECSSISVPIDSSPLTSHSPTTSSMSSWYDVAGLFRKLFSSSSQPEPTHTSSFDV